MSVLKLSQVFGQKMAKNDLFRGIFGHFYIFVTVVQFPFLINRKSIKNDINRKRIENAKIYAQLYQDKKYIRKENVAK